MTVGFNVCNSNCQPEHYLTKASKAFIGGDEYEYKVKVYDIHAHLSIQPSFKHVIQKKAVASNSSHYGAQKQGK